MTCRRVRVTWPVRRHHRLCGISHTWRVECAAQRTVRATTPARGPSGRDGQHGSLSTSASTIVAVQHFFNLSGTVAGIPPRDGERFARAELGHQLGTSPTRARENPNAMRHASVASKRDTENRERVFGGRNRRKQSQQSQTSEGAFDAAQQDFGCLSPGSRFRSYVKSVRSEVLSSELGTADAGALCRACSSASKLCYLC